MPTSEENLTPKDLKIYDLEAQIAKFKEAQTMMEEQAGKLAEELEEAEKWEKTAQHYHDHLVDPTSCKGANCEIAKMFLARDDKIVKDTIVGLPDSTIRELMKARKIFEVPEKLTITGLSEKHFRR